MWEVSHRADPFARDIADRHYNRQKVGSPQFAPPGRCLVLSAQNDTGRAFWITSWPFARYVKHRWTGAWVCSAFRNEDFGVASEMIAGALAATVSYYGIPPALGMVTFLDRKKVRPIRKRGRDHWGYTWEKVGFQFDGETKGGLMAFRLPFDAFPPPVAAIGDPPRHRDYRTPDHLWLEVAL